MFIPKKLCNEIDRRIIVTDVEQIIYFVMTLSDEILVAMKASKSEPDKIRQHVMQLATYCIGRTNIQYIFVIGEQQNDKLVGYVYLEKKASVFLQQVRRNPWHNSTHSMFFQSKFPISNDQA